jgi:uncharacterized protein YuzE
MATLTHGLAESRYDAAADILYIVAAEGPVARSVEVAPGITIEYGEGGDILGVEILRASRILARQVVAGLHAKQAGVL